MNRKKRILVAPLDWGLGHASRCIPIIHEILAQEHEVVLAADGRALELLKAEFPAVTCIRLPGYHPLYPKDGSMVWKMAVQVPKFLRAIAREHFQLKKIIREYSIEAVISDNRYGLWSKSTPCVLLTHQLFIRMPAGMKWFEPAVNLLNHFFIRKFQRCWVPDVESDENLSGELSHGKPIPSNVEYLGILSRFSVSPAGKKYDVLALLSGPEPQRTILEEKIICQLTALPLRALVARGVPEETSVVQRTKNMEVVSHLESKKLNEAFLQSEVVICRSGYSSIMELASLGKAAILIPTPGQTEQEYLAQLLSERKRAVVQEQNSLDIKRGLEKIKETQIRGAAFDSAQFKVALRGFLDALA